MEKLNDVIRALECCLDSFDACPGCYLNDYDGCRDQLNFDVLKLLKKLDEGIKSQGEVILELNRDLKRCRDALNAQGEYAYLGGDLISRNALTEGLESLDWYSDNEDGVFHSGAAGDESAYVRWGDVVRVVEAAGAVEAVEIPDAKLLRAVKLLLKQYEHSKNSEYVHSPVAHAFFHTWKQLDERRE